MTVLLQAGDPGSIGNQNVTQGEFRDQINAINDAIRQLAGQPTINPGDTVVNEPLNTPYVLYVNQDIGEDTFVFRDPYDYSTQAGLPAGVEADSMRRISQQRLVAGYTESRPFKTLNRAVIEAAILTSRDYLGSDCCAVLRNRVTICVTGEILVYNDENPQDACSDYFDTPFVPGPDHLYTPGMVQLSNGDLVSELYYWNPTNGGMLLPRGVSVVSLDLRKSVIRPHYSPCPEPEAEDKSNRRAIFKVTGEGYYYGFTFMDQAGASSSHHLLDCFQFSTKAELDDFYLKVKKKFGDQIPFDDGLIQTNDTEYQIVGPNPNGNPTIATDTTASASPYVYNCSIRSMYGLCGIFCDGSRVDGFKSLVTAQFTGVSLQTDINAWEKYDPSGTNPTYWTYIDDYTDLIEQSPDDVRQKTKWRAFHIRAINKAVIQEVSVFAIGQGIHHWVESGGEITITNSNSNFGGAAALAQGYNPSVSINDGPWNVVGVHRALDPFEKSASPSLLTLGVLAESQANDAKTLILENELFESQFYPGQPDSVRKYGYTLKAGDFIWVRNRYGPDYRARLAVDPWTADKPNEIRLAAEMRTDIESGMKSPGIDEEEYPSLANNQVYIRRFEDKRDKTQRSWWLIIQGCDGLLRVPYRDYVLRDVNDKWSQDDLPAVARTRRDRTGCDKVEVTLRDASSGLGRSGHLTGTYYRRGDSVRRQGKHWVATEDHMGEWDSSKWNEGYVHMEDWFVPEGQILNSAPKIIFDGDNHQAEQTTNCGFSLGDKVVKAQYQSATDYKGLANYLKVNDEVNCDLVPQPLETQDAAISPDEQINFHRPSNIRMFNHAWEWAGYLNYSKALPKYQKQISPTNKWTYYFTNQDGGKCYVSGFNEEGFQVTAKGLIDLATGDEIAGIDIGTPEEDVDRAEGVVIGDAATRRPDRRPDEYGEEPFPRGIVMLAQAGEANPDLTVEREIEVNNAIENADSGALKKPWLEEYVRFQRFVKAPKDNIAAVVIHVVPSGQSSDALGGRDSVPYGIPSDSDDYTQFNRQEWEAQGKPSTLTQALGVAASVYVPVGSEIIICLHGDLTATERGPLQLVNSYARVVVASARGLTTPAIIKMDRYDTANALGRFPQFKDDYSFSAGLVFTDVHCKVNGGGQACYLTFNGGVGLGLQGLIVEIESLGGFALCNASFGQGAGIFVFPDTNQAFIDMKVLVKSVDGAWVNSSDRQPYVHVFGQEGHPREDVGSGLTGHGIDLTIDFRNAGYGDPGRCQINWVFENESPQKTWLCFLAVGGRGGCRAGGRVAPIVDFDFGGESRGNWDLGWWISKRWLENQNYFGRHFQVRDVGGDFRGTYNVSSSAYATFKPRFLTRGSCIDIEQENRWQCGPFGLFAQFESAGGAADNTALRSDVKYGSYIYSGNDARRGNGLGNNSGD